ncbi:MAG: hypothetical protein ISP01_05380 [Methanobrevibacter arboriphilus]|uniref:Uncharacterized protein n=1 Tax=Methanobrevibacter arboriphilus TaxID=39441 RepID=A0A843APW5_METAZ|nr:hypothetical protein [Methanobrevibacter arboriphilus]MBF4468820.1 hypothetical protein [Methanobrevibacter arboriphilus]
MTCECKTQNKSDLAHCVMMIDSQEQACELLETMVEYGLLEEIGTDSYRLKK